MGLRPISKRGGLIYIKAERDFRSNDPENTDSPVTFARRCIRCRRMEPTGSTVSPNSLFARMGGRTQLLFLLRHFYADVRQHHEIGPIFTAQITHWPAHLEKIADFWSNVTGGPIAYNGPMPQKHFPLGLEPRHFEAWLDLWRRHCNAHLGSTEAKEMIAAAEGIGERLRWLIAHAARPASL